MAKHTRLCLFTILLLSFLFGSYQVQAVPYDYSFTHECLAKPLGPQYGGGIVVNPELENGLMAWTNFGDAKINHQQSQDGNKFIVASNRTQSFHSASQTFNLDKDKLYTFSAWLQVSKGEDVDIAAVVKTQNSNETVGWAIARNGCWSMLKGGLVVNTSGPAHLYFESNTTNVDIWADSISLQPFTQEEWKSHQDQSVEKFRKGKVKLQALDKNGQPIANASVSVNQTNGGYKLGCAINQNILQNKAYQNWFLSRFKFTVFENELKWYATENTRGRDNYKVADAMVQFAKSHGVSVRRHNVFWDSKNPKYQPPWVPGLSTNDLWAAANNRINSVMRRYAGQLFHWDVVNENLHFSFFEGKLGSKASTIFYQNANKIDYRTTPFLNDFNTIEEPKDGSSSPAKYLQKIDQLRREGYNGPLGIGLEGHFHYANIPYIRSALDQLGRYRLPLWVTELDVSSGPNQADYLSKILWELKGHPAVGGIVMWAAWNPQGCYSMCLTDNNFKNLATGNVVDRFRHQLSEGAEGVTDSDGFFEASLHHGEYEARVSHPADESLKIIKKFEVKEGTDEKLHFTVNV